MNQEQPSTQDLPGLRYEEVTHHIDRRLQTVQENNGGQTSTPARPESVQGPEPDNIQNPEPNAQPSSDSKEEKMSTFMRNGIIVGSIALLLVLAGIISAAVILSNRNKSSYVKAPYYSKVNLVNSDSALNTSKILTTDAQTLGTNNAIPVYVTKIAKPAATTADGKTRALQEAATPLSSFTIVDQSTDTTITAFSKGLDLKVGIDSNSVLETVLNNQPQIAYESEISDTSLTTNLQSSGDPTAIEQKDSQQFVFYEVIDKMAGLLKSELAKLDPKVKVDQTVCHDMQYNKDKAAFEFTPVNNAEPVDPVNLYTASDIPKIKNLNNETEVAEAAVSLVMQIVTKSKDFFTKNAEELQKKSEVPLVPSEPNAGNTSVQRDRPQDIEKLCSTVSDTVIRCENRVFDSKLINIDSKSADKQYQPKPTIVVIMDA